MTIIIIEGPEKSGKSLLGNALRNNQISKKQGGLLIDEDQDGDPVHLLEKILDGVAFPGFTPKAGQLPWKDNSSVILIGTKKAMLDEFERIVPGFTKQLGPIIKIKTE